MRILPAIAIAALSTAALAGSAAAANHHDHVMNVPLPDGSIARVQYVGDVAPKITIERASSKEDSAWAALPSFTGMERMFAQIDQENEALLREARALASSPTAATPHIASFGNSPAGMTSTTVISYSNAAGTCTRTSEAISQGPGKPPKVRSSISGDCGQSPVSPGRSAPVNRT